MQGAQGPMGPCGAKGATGAQGPVGPTGVALLGAYGTFVSTEPRVIGNEAPVILDAVLNTSNSLGFVPGSDYVTVQLAGVYQIVYSVRPTAAACAACAAVSLLVNGAEIVNSTLAAALDAAQRTGFATIALAAGDTVSIGTSDGTLSLAEETNAFLSLLRIA